MKTHSIGIDFGTTKTLVSHINPQTGVAETIRLGRGCDYVPSSVYVEANGHFMFGDDADDMVEDETGVYLRGFKMKLGSSTPLHMCMRGSGMRMLTAKDLVYEYLRYIKHLVEEKAFMGESVTKAVITRPVNFTPAQSEELKHAAQAAGFSNVEFTSEPEAAGLAFCRLQAAHAFKGNALVVDWGGGTLDFALVSRKGDTVSTHRSHTDGDTTMGGEVFDDRLWMYVNMEMKKQGVSLNPVAMLPKVRLGKEQLSARDSINLRLSHPQGVTTLPLARNVFNCMIASDVDKAVEKVKALLKGIPAALKPEMLLLVGGSSQIPLIKEKLEKACALPAKYWANSREAVALGACLWGTKAAPEPAPAPKPVLSPKVTPAPKPQLVDIAKKAQENALKKARDLYFKAMDLLYKHDFEPMIPLFEESYSLGNLSAGWVLAQCYQLGAGVPRSYKEMLRIAKELTNKWKSPIGYSFFVEAYRSGTGVSMSINEAHRLESKLMSMASAPLPDVEDEIRVLALICACSDEDKLANLREEFSRVSRHPARSVAKVLNMPEVEHSQYYQQQARNLLDEAAQSGNSEALWAKFHAVTSGRFGYIMSDDQTRALIRKAARPLAVSSDVLYSAYQAENDEKQSEVLLSRFWAACNWGWTHKIRKDRLPCRLSLNPSDVSAIWHVYPEAIFHRERVKKDQTCLMQVGFLPILVIHNTGNKTLSGLQLRFCIKGKDEYCRKINKVIQPNSSVQVDLDLFGDVPLAECEYLELIDSSGAYAELDLGESSVIATSTNHFAPPLAFWYESGIFGGIVVKMQSLEGNVENVTVVKLSNEATANVAVVNAQEPESVGWVEFSDGAGLQQGEEFAVVVPGYGIVYGKITDRVSKVYKQAIQSESMGGGIDSVPVNQASSQSNSAELFYLVACEELGKTMTCIEKGNFSKSTLREALSYAHSETMRKLISRYI